MANTKDDIFFVIHHWMIKALELKDTELMVYAVIYGFYKNGGRSFSGGVSYLTDITAKKRTAVNGALKALVGRKLLIKTEKNVYGRKSVSYAVNEEILNDILSKSEGSENEQCVQNPDLGRSENEQCVQNSDFGRSENEQYVQNSDFGRSENEQVCSENEHLCSENEQVCSENEQVCSENEHNNIYNINNKNNNIIDTHIYGKSNDGRASPAVVRIVEKWNTLSVYGIPRVIKIDPGMPRYRQLIKLIKLYGEDVILNAVDKVGQSDFLTGANGGWRIDFDFFVRSDKFLKILEGGYENHETLRKRAPENPWDALLRDAEEREMDIIDC